MANVGKVTVSLTLDDLPHPDDREALWAQFTAGEKLAYGCGVRDERARIARAVRDLPTRHPHGVMASYEHVNKPAVLRVVRDEPEEEW